MKIAVTIIAHNEEAYIERCIESVLQQTLKPDEIILVCHNCSDKTEDIVRKFEGVKTVSLSCKEGIVYARMKAYESVSSDIDIIAATDGDSFLNKNWLERLTKPFADEGVVATGGMVFFKKSIYANLISLSFFFLNPIFRRKFIFYFWGANHAFRKNVYEKSGGLGNLIELKEKLNLNYWADDLYLSLLFLNFGEIEFVPFSVVWTKSPIVNNRAWKERVKMQNSDRTKLFEFFKIPVK